MSFFAKAFRLYYDGFRNMGKLGKRLWLIIFIKLFVMFVVLKLFFFKDKLGTDFATDQERSNHIINVMTNQSSQHGAN